MDLLDLMNKPLRDRLCELGWRQVGGQRDGRPYWLAPDDGRMLIEEEAFRWLERHDKQEASDGGQR